MRIIATTCFLFGLSWSVANADTTSDPGTLIREFYQLAGLSNTQVEALKLTARSFYTRNDFTNPVQELDYISLPYSFPLSSTWAFVDLAKSRTFDVSRSPPVNGYLFDIAIKRHEFADTTKIYRYLIVREDGVERIYPARIDVKPWTDEILSKSLVVPFQRIHGNYETPNERFSDDSCGQTKHSCIARVNSFMAHYVSGQRQDAFTYISPSFLDANGVEPLFANFTTFNEAPMMNYSILAAFRSFVDVKVIHEGQNDEETIYRFKLIREEDQLYLHPSKLAHEGRLVPWWSVIEGQYIHIEDEYSLFTGDTMRDQGSESEPKLEETDKAEEGGNEEDELRRFVSMYTPLIWQKISRHWRRPSGVRSDSEAHVNIRLKDNGQVISVSIIKSSSNEAFDRSVQEAVRAASPIPIPPNPSVNKEFRNLNLRFKSADMVAQ